MPIKEGIEYGVNDALTNLRSKTINTTPDLPLATRINLLKDKDPKRYQENMQRLIQAEKDGNEEAIKLLGEIGEDAGRSRRGYEWLATAMTFAPMLPVAGGMAWKAMDNPWLSAGFDIATGNYGDAAVGLVTDFIPFKKYIKKFNDIKLDQLNNGFHIGNLYFGAGKNLRYRNIGNDFSGVEDLLKTGEVLPPKDVKGREIRPGIVLKKTFTKPYFGHAGKLVDPKQYKGKYFLSTIDEGFYKPQGNWGYLKEDPIKIGEVSVNKRLFSMPGLNNIYIRINPQNIRGKVFDTTLNKNIKTNLYDFYSPSRQLYQETKKFKKD